MSQPSGADDQYVSRILATQVPGPPVICPRTPSDHPNEVEGSAPEQHGGCHGAGARQRDQSENQQGGPGYSLAEREELRMLIPRRRKDSLRIGQKTCQGTVDQHQAKVGLPQVAPNVEKSVFGLTPSQAGATPLNMNDGQREKNHSKVGKYGF